MQRQLHILLMLFFAFLSKAQLQINPVTGLDCLTGKGSATIIPLTGTPPYSFTWSPSVSTGSIANNLNTGTYNFTVVDAANNSVVSQISINLSILMNITTISPGTNSINCFGGNNGALSVTVTGSAVDPPFTYTWSTGSNSSFISNLSAGVYTISATDNNGCTKTSTIQVLQPSQINSVINASLACNNQPITTTITTTGGIAPYTYTVDGNPITGVTITSLTAGNHTIITRDANNCIKTDVVNVIQPPAPVFNFTKTQPSCPTSTNGALSVTVSNMAAPYTYTWLPVFLNTQTIMNIPQGIYTVSVKDGKNCAGSVTISLLPISNIQTQTITKPETCSAADGAATVNVSGGAAPYTYSFNSLPAQVSNVGNNLSTGIQTVVVTDAASCSLVATFSVGNTSLVQLNILTFKDVKCFEACDGELVLSTINAVAPVSYSLTGLPIFTSNTITGICSGTYVVKAVDNIGCYATVAVSFSTPPFYSFNTVGNTLICIGKTAVLQSSVAGGTAPYNYNWQPGNSNALTLTVTPNVTTVYSLQVTDANGCTKTPSTVTVNVRPPVTVTVSQQNTGICPGTTAQITPSVSGGDGNYTYLWLPGNSSDPSIFISNLTNPTYTFMVNDGCGGSPVQQIINLQIFPVTTPEFIADTLFGCQPLCVKFSNATANSTSPVWNFGDQPAEQIGSNPTYCYEKPGKYNVKLSITDANGCRFSRTVPGYIDVYARPVPGFVTNPKVITDMDGEAELINTTSNATFFNWQVDGINQGGDHNIKLFFNDTVCFMVKLFAANTKGCTDSITEQVCVKPGFTFYMPKAFTPNGDGINDILLPKGNAWKLEGYIFNLFNRWGQLIFSTNDIGTGWDGKVNGGPVSTDEVYVWTVRVTDIHGEEHELKGDVILLH